MFTPYDWQEGIGNRAQYIEAKLAQGSPVLALSLPEGVLAYTFRRQMPKLYEIYDRLLFAGVGQQADVEALRGAALEFASKEGYNRSDEDVTITRVVQALSGSLKRSFSDFSAAPVVARSLFVEVGETIEADRYYVLDYDGDFAVTSLRAVAAGSLEVGESVEKKIAEISVGSPAEAVLALRSIWRFGVDPEGQLTDEAVFGGLTEEAILLERSGVRENRFRWIVGAPS